MTFRRVLIAAALTLLVGVTACNNDNFKNSGSLSLTRFQVVGGSVDTFLVDGASGDLWRLDEQPGDEPAVWTRYASGPADARKLDLKELLGGEEAKEPEGP